MNVLALLRASKGGAVVNGLLEGCWRAGCRCQGSRCETHERGCAPACTEQCSQAPNFTHRLLCRLAAASGRGLPPPAGLAPPPRCTAPRCCCGACAPAFLSRLLATPATQANSRTAYQRVSNGFIEAPPVIRQLAAAARWLCTWPCIQGAAPPPPLPTPTHPPTLNRRPGPCC